MLDQSLRAVDSDDLECVAPKNSCNRSGGDRAENPSPALPHSPDADVGQPVCAVVRPGAPFIGRQGLSYAPAISAETVGARAIHMQLITIPPGAWGRAHKHHGHESTIYVLGGESAMYYGERLEHHLVARRGEFLYIPADVPHQPYNLSATEPCLAVIARTDPNEQESVVLLPELEAIHARSASDQAVCGGADRTEASPAATLSSLAGAAGQR